MVDAWMRCVLFAAFAAKEVGALGEAGDDSSHLFTPGHMVHAPMLDDLNPMPLWAPVLMASNKTNITFGGVGSPTVDSCKASYNADDIFGSNLSMVLSTGNGAFDTFALVQPWYNRGNEMDSVTEMDSKDDFSSQSLPAFYSFPAFYSKYDLKTKTLQAFYSMAVVGGGAPGHVGGLLLREGTPDEIALEEPFDAGSIGDADIKYSFPYNQTNSKEDPGSGEKGGVPLRWLECLDGALALFRLGLLIFAVCSEQERSGPNKCFAMWARRNRSYRNKWRSAIWARHNRSYRNKWFKLALVVLLVPRVRATVTTTPPPNGDGTGAYRRDEAGAHQAESGAQMPPLGPPPLTPFCADDVDSGAFDAGGAPMPCSYFSAQPSACPSYSIAQTTCPVACDTCSPLLPPSPPLLLLPLPTPPPPVGVPSPPPPWSPLMALPCTVLPCSEASDVPGIYQGLQLAVPSHRRELQTQVSTSASLLSALANTAVNRIVLAPGTYILNVGQLSITRSLVLEAAVAGSVILNAQANSTSPRRWLNINPGPTGVVQVIGLNITGGYLYNVLAHVQSFPLASWDALLTCFSTLACKTAADAPVNYRLYVPQRPEIFLMGKCLADMLSTLSPFYNLVLPGNCKCQP